MISSGAALTLSTYCCPSHSGARTVEELDFYLELKTFLRRCETQGVGNRGAFPTLVQVNGIAHLVRTVARAKKISTIQERPQQG